MVSSVETDHPEDTGSCVPGRCEHNPVSTQQVHHSLSAAMSPARPWGPVSWRSSRTLGLANHALQHQSQN
jgi:hypothetical protein